jgi:hypothetical protein
VIIAAVAYLAFGGLVAYAIDKSFDINKRLIALPLIALLWPMAIFFAFFAFFKWAADGSH